MSSAKAEGCPNAAFRQGPSANLPDCRAYELVTPPFKNGEFPFVGFRFLDASHVLFATLGAPGNPADNPSAEGADYAAGRGPSGWSSTPFEPPASQFENAGQIQPRLEDVSQDFQRILFSEVPTSSRPVDLRYYIREPDGSFVEVGPWYPPGAVASWTQSNGDTTNTTVGGASRDLSHIVFQQAVNATLTDFRWPGDITLENQSLYEYVGTGNAVPRLVGVDNLGNLISQCGTYLGASEFLARNAHNAISADGSTVFFTAQNGGCSDPHGIQSEPGSGPPTNEVFARVNQSRTVAISEPTTGPGGDCEPCNTSAPVNAIFQGASSDGSKAFFLTEQPLGPNDGDTSTDLYMYDFKAPGQRIVQVSGGGAGDATPGSGAQVQGVTGVSQDGSHVYFVAEGVLTTDPNKQGQSAVASNDNLYVYEPDPAHPGQSMTVFIAALSGADSEVWEKNDSRPVALTPDGRFLLFQSAGNLTPDASGAASQIYRYDAQTGDLVRISIGENGFNHNGNVDNNFASFVGSGSGAHVGAGTTGVSISDDGSYVFFTSVAGLTPQAIDDPNFEYPNVYEYHDGHVYLISDGQDRHKVFGGTTVQLLGATASGSDVFFTTADPLTPQDTDTQMDIYDARIGGGFPAPVAPESCQGDACQGALSGTPSGQAPGSFTFSGPGNPAPPVTKPAVKPKAKPLTRAQKLAKALKECKKKPKKRRATCVKQTRRKYGKSARKSIHANRRGK